MDIQYLPTQTLLCSTTLSTETKITLLIRTNLILSAFINTTSTCDTVTHMYHFLLDLETVLARSKNWFQVNNGIVILPVRFAMMEEKAVISLVLRKFSLTSKLQAVDIPLLAELVLRSKCELLCTFTKRNKYNWLDYPISRSWPAFLDCFWAFASSPLGVKGTHIFSCNEQLKNWCCHSVRSSGRSCFRPSPFFLLVSLKFLLVLKSFNGVSRQFKECLKFNGSFKAVSRKF